MNFQKKNFKYTTKHFGAFLDDVDAGCNEYLRSLASEKPADKPAELITDYPGLAQDFQLPKELELVSRNAHSSVLRISGPVTMWLHYDVSDRLKVIDDDLTSPGYGQCAMSDSRLQKASLIPSIRYHASWYPPWCLKFLS